MQRLEKSMIAKLRVAFARGTSVRKAAAKFRLSLSTVSKYFAVFAVEPE